MRFRITYTEYGYKTSVPGYLGGDVVTADEHDAIRARLAEAEAQRNSLNGIVRILIGCIEDLKQYENPDDFAEELEAAREELAKLGEK